MSGETAGFWESFLPGLAGAGSAYLGYELAGQLGQTGDDAASQMGELAGILADDTAFKGYGVTTGLGTSMVGADGSTDLGVGPSAVMQEQATAANTAGNSAAWNAAVTASMSDSNPLFMQALGQYQNAANAFGDRNAVNNFMQNGAGYLGQSAERNKELGGAAANAALRETLNASMDTGAREREIYNRSMAMQNPMLDQAQASQQANEFAMGRGGVRGSQFGGTAEDAAMARARAQASNQASFQAMGQAQQERMNAGQLASMYNQTALGANQGIAGAGGQLGQLGTQTKAMTDAAMMNQAQIGGMMGSLGAQQAQIGQGAAALQNQLANTMFQQGNQQYQNSFIPMQQQMAAMQLAQGNAGMAQSGQFTGAGYGAQLGLGGIQAQINAQKAASELYGNMFNSIMNNSGAMGAGLDNIWNSIFGD